MARVALPLVLGFLILLSFDGAATVGARGVPAADVKKDCIEEGTVVIPGIGRYELGSHEMPSINGLDHSVPAAASGQYIPGNDDTFVPNPGFEVPNPAHATAP